MEFETLLTGSRWEILTLLAQRPLSPSELALKTKTTVANISAQLRLLELANIVKKNRIQTSEPGKPRLQYRIANTKLLYATIAKHHTDKKFVSISQIEHAIVCVLSLDISEKTHVIEYLLRHAKKLHSIVFGIQQQGNTTIIGVVGEHSLPSVETKPYKITVRKVSSLEGFPIIIGE